MESFSGLMPVVGQLINALTARDRGQQSKAEMENVVRNTMQDCLQQHLATERREVVNNLMELLKERVSQPVEKPRETDVDKLVKMMNEMKTGKEAKPTGRDVSASDKKLVMEVLQEMLNDLKSEQNKSRGKTGERSSVGNFVLPWCDGPDDSKSKASGKGKACSEKQGSANDAPGHNFQKDKGFYEKKKFNAQVSQKFDQGRGGFQGGNRRNFSQERAHKGNDGPVEGAGRPFNNAPRGNPRNYGADQHQRGQQYQHGQREGAVEYNPLPHQKPVNQSPTPSAPPYNYQAGPASTNTNYYNHPGGMPGHAGPPPPLIPSWSNPQLGSYGPHHPHQQFPQQQPQFPQQHQQFSQQPQFPQQRQQFSQQQQFPQQQQQFSQQPQFPQHQQRQPFPHQAGGNFNNTNYQQRKQNFGPQGGNRGRGGPNRGGYQNRGGHHTSRPEARGHDNSGSHGSLSDLTATLSPEELKTIKNILKSEPSGANPKKLNKNKVAFKQKKNNVPGKQTAGENDEQEDDETNNFATEENKVLEDKLPEEAELTGAKKKKKKNRAKQVDEDEKLKEVDSVTSNANSKDLKLLIGLGINKDMLDNVDPNQEIKDVVLIAHSGNETKTCQPRRVKELKDFMDKYPKAEAIIVKKE